MLDTKNNKKLEEVALAILVKHEKHFPSLWNLNWKIKFASRRMTRTFGTAHYRTNTIQVSPVLCELNKINWDSKELEELIIHEFTHLYLYWRLGECVGHGKEFQDKMKQCFPEGTIHDRKTYTYHTMKVEKRKDKWLLTCPVCKNQTTSKRRGNWACYKCCNKHNNGKWDNRYKLIHTEINK